MPHRAIVRHRHFFALLPPPAEAGRIARMVERWFTATGSPVRRDRLHITLFALPAAIEVPSGLEERLCEAARAIAAAPVAVTLDRLSGGGGPIVLRPSRRIVALGALHHRSEEHTSELQSLMRISYAVFCLKKQTNKT